MNALAYLAMVPLLAIVLWAFWYRHTDRGHHGEPAHDEVYVRSYRGIKEYPETEIEPFPYDKELDSE